MTYTNDTQFSSLRIHRHGHCELRRWSVETFRTPHTEPRSLGHVDNVVVDNGVFRNVELVRPISVPLKGENPRIALGCVHVSNVGRTDVFDLGQEESRHVTEADTVGANRKSVIRLERFVKDAVSRSGANVCHVSILCDRGLEVKVCLKFISFCGIQIRRLKRCRLF